MNAALLMAAAIMVYFAAYRVYGSRVSRRFRIDSERKTPAVRHEDGRDFVPARSWWVLFGHHFSSICGAGPIVGPVLACAYWGWGVSLLWIVCGAVLMGAVSDFSALVMSVRAGGSSISAIAGEEISRRAKLAFSVFLWIALILVIAVFVIFAAKTFGEEPDAVVPSFGLIPTAMVTGWLLYVRRFPNLPVTLGGLAVVLLLLYAGYRIPVVMPVVGGFSAQTLWILILLGYCLVAAVLPVQLLLQPRDYLASFILFAMIAVGIASIFVTRPVMQSEIYTSFHPDAWPQAGPVWPMLFVTIACGAISGFHSLVSSGTTCRQLASEGHACRIGYGGMLLESTVAVLVLIAVSAGLGPGQLAFHLKNGGPIAAFGYGYGELTHVFLGSFGKGFAVLALNAFILTTLDTATRITRYLTTELFGIRHPVLATGMVVIAAGTLALSGKWSLLWPAFGAANQLIAGVTLLVASCWLLARGERMLLTLIPAALMLMTTLAAFFYQGCLAFFRTGADGRWEPDLFMTVTTAILVLTALSIFMEAFKILKSLKRIRA